MPDTLTLSPLRTLTFLTSAARFEQCPADQGIEVAFAGRSNAGKSSAINALAQQRQLARSSKTPGRTQLLNFFHMPAYENRYLVDLPGYGYAAVSKATQASWSSELGRYLRERSCLAGLILLMDIRHPCQDLDLSLIDWCMARTLPVHILLTKADKLNRGPATLVRNRLRNQFGDHPHISIQTFSALRKTGLEECDARIRSWLNIPDTPHANTADFVQT